MTVSDRLLEFFCDKGIKHVFLIPGAQIDPLINASINLDAISIIIPNHELSAGYMADGYARISSNIGVVFSIGSCGATNLIAAAVNTRIEKSPVVFVTGSVSSSDYGSGCFQDTSKIGSNDMAIFKEAIGYSLVCGDAEDIDKCINQIIDHTDKKRPFHLAIPLDIQQQEINKHKVVLKNTNISVETVSNNYNQINQDINLLQKKELLTSLKYDIISLQTVMLTLEDVFMDNTVYCLDSGQVRLAGNTYLGRKDNTFLLQSKKQAPMGWAICASIGVKLAVPNRSVVAIFGDGSMRMHGIELATAIRYNIPIVFVLCDNQAYGTIYSRYKEKESVELSYLDDVNWQTYVASFGMKTFHVVDESSLYFNLQEASKLMQPCLVWIHIPIEDNIMQQQVYDL